MTEHEIFALARECGATGLKPYNKCLADDPIVAFRMTPEQLARFATEVAAKAPEIKTRDGVVVKPGDKVWVNGSVSVEPVTVQPVEPLTDYELFGPIPVARAFSTEAAARVHRYER